MPQVRSGIVPFVGPGPAIGLAAQVAMLAVLAQTLGLSRAGWITGVVHGLFVCVALSWGMRRTGSAELGPADWVTLTRVILVGCVAALVADSFTRPVLPAVLVAITIVALMLDGLDGQVARRTHTASELGARFDMEADAFLIFVLSAYVARSLGWWVLAIGAMRYAYVAASWVLSWMRRRLPPRFWRKVVAAVQGVVLLVAASSVLPDSVNTVAVAGALLLLIESFGRDVLWLYQRRPVLSHRH